MSKRLLTGCYWPARDESIEVRAQRTSAVLQSLSRCDAALSRWFEKAYSLKKALTLEFSPTPEKLREMISKKYSELFSAWTGQRDNEEGAALSVLEGNSGLSPSTCMLDMSSTGSLWARVGTATGLAAILRCMALAWDPEWGIATSHQYWNSLSPRPELGEFTGWVTYYSRGWGIVPPLPAPTRIEPVEDKGTLVILTPERFSMDNPEHVDHAARVNELLKRAGLLKRISK